MERSPIKFKFVFVQRVAASLIVLIFGLMVWSLYESDIFLVKTIELEIENSRRFTFPKQEAEVANELRALLGTKIWQISFMDVSESLKERNWVQDFKLTRVWPNRVRVDLKVKLARFVFQPERNWAPLGKQELVIFDDGSYLPKNQVQGELDLPVLKLVPEWSSELASSQVIALFKKANEFLSYLPSRGPFSLEMISEFFFSEQRGWVVRLLGVEHEIRMGKDELAIRAERVSRVLAYLQSHAFSPLASSNFSSKENSKFLERTQMFARVIDANLSKKVLVRPRNQP